MSYVWNNVTYYCSTPLWFKKYYPLQVASVCGLIATCGRTKIKYVKRDDCRSGVYNLIIFVRRHICTFFESLSNGNNYCISRFYRHILRLAKRQIVPLYGDRYQLVFGSFLDVWKYVHCRRKRHFPGTEWRKTITVRSFRNLESIQRRNHRIVWVEITLARYTSATDNISIKMQNDF